VIKAILFDLDGVVINSEHLYEKVERLMFDQYGIVISEKEQKGLKGTTEEDFYNYIEERFHPNWDRKKLIKEGRELLTELFSRDVKCMPGFFSLIDRFHGRYRLGLVTSTRRQLLEQIFQVVPIEGLFQEIISANDISHGKPHPEPYLEMMKRLHVTPDEVIVIEDSIHGITSAKASGAICIALEGSFSREELHSADHVVESLNEINDILIQNLVK